jgi:hypothetical protein
MNRKFDILKGVEQQIVKAAEMYGGTKRSELKDNDFLFPETRSFPIVTPADVPHAINNFGRMGGNMSYDAFLHKLYNMCKRKGSDFVAALPDASKEKLGINKTKADNLTDIITTIMQPSDTNVNPEMSMDEHQQELYEMNLAAFKAIFHHVNRILKNIEDPDVMENLTEPWLQGKIAVAEDYISTIHDFLMYSEEVDDTLEAGDKSGLWDNIRKKRQREGKNYKPAKPGDKDRPDSKQWDKLTSKKKPKIGDVSRNVIPLCKTKEMMG